tara:strand:- start:50518 stop:50979 length:462 start_codon:yes stop_codon:yes gene_type:complete
MINKAFRCFHSLVAILLIMMVLISFVNVLFRYFLNETILWADEISVYIMISVIWMGAIISSKNNSHIKMDIFLGLIKNKLFKKTVLIFNDFIIFICSAWCASLSMEYTLKVARFGMMSDASGIPMWILHSNLTGSFIFISAIYFIHIIKTIRE